MANLETQLSLEDAVQEVLGLLTGLDLTYDSTADRYRAITRQLNRATRANALEREWSYYSDQLTVGLSVAGQREFLISDDVRPRIIGDDAVRLCDATTGKPIYWAYFIPRDALHKYAMRRDLKVAITRSTLLFSRPFADWEAGFEVRLPIMREPENIRLPADPDEEPDAEILAQLIDFPYPDVVVSRAAYYVALSDPVMQPRAQTLEAEYKDLMYQLIEREERHTDTPLQNDFFVPVQNTIYPESRYRPWPVADSRR